MEDYIEIMPKTETVSDKTEVSVEPKQVLDKPKRKRKIKVSRILMVIVVVLILFAGVYYDQTVSYANKLMKTTGLAGITMVEGDENTAAIVGDAIISMDELNEEYNKIPEMVQAFTPKSRILESMVSQKMLLKEVEEKGINVDDEKINERINEIKQTNNLNDEEFEAALLEINLALEEYIAKTKDIIAIENYLDDFVFKEIITGDEEIKIYYNENINLFEKNEEVTAAHVLISSSDRSEEEALAIIQALKQRAEKDNFTFIVKEYSEDPSKEMNNGVLVFEKGQMVAEFEQAAFNLNVGEVSEPVKTVYGYHLIKLLGKEDARTLELEEVKDEIKDLIENEEKEEALITYLEALKEKYDVEIFYSDEI